MSTFTDCLLRLSPGGTICMPNVAVIRLAEKDLFECAEIKLMNFGYGSIVGVVLISEGKYTVINGRKITVK